MKKVRKAIVLAAGLGTRLRPFTCVTPKPLMPVWGEPMLERIVNMLREWGVDDIAFNSHHLSDQISAWAEGYRKACAEKGDAVSVQVSYEPEILGTGGVLNPLRKWIGDEPFYLVNGDIVMENVTNPLTKVGDFESPSVIGCCLVTEEGPRTIEVEPEYGYVTNWKSQDAGWSGTYTYCGVALLKPEILDFVEPQGFSTVISAYEKAMMQGKFVKAIKCDDMLWTDAGTISSYIDLNRTDDDNAFDAFPQLRAAGVAAPIEFLGARGSERVFFRAGDRIVVLYDDANRVENGKYAGHARFLKASGMPVPEILVDLPDQKVLVMSDGGVEKKMTLEEYVKVVETLAKFNALGEKFVAEPKDPSLPELMSPFDSAMWEWERNLFEEYCLHANFQMDMPEAVRKELVRVAEVLESEPKALVHRDFQSTNVLWRKDRMTIIDFQGMRLGPAAYDLAALVYDPYVTFTEGERRALVALYARKAGREEMVKTFPFAAVQRLVQCLGAFGRLASVGQPQFGKHVLPALENLLDAADKAGLDAIGALAEDLIAKQKHFLEHANGHSHSHDGECSCGHHH